MLSDGTSYLQATAVWLPPVPWISERERERCVLILTCDPDSTAVNYLLPTCVGSSTTKYHVEDAVQDYDE